MRRKVIARSLAAHWIEGKFLFGGIFCDNRYQERGIEDEVSGTRYQGRGIGDEVSGIRYRGRGIGDEVQRRDTRERYERGGEGERYGKRSDADQKGVDGKRKLEAFLVKYVENSGS